MADISITKAGGIITITDEAFPNEVFTHREGELCVRMITKTGPHYPYSVPYAHAFGKKCEDQAAYVIEHKHETDGAIKHIFCFSECTAPTSGTESGLLAAIAAILV